MSAPLIALAVAAFGIGTTEFVVMGLLPEVARDLGVSIPAAGLLVTGYAAGVVIGAPLMAVVTNGLPRKATLLGLVALFIAGNLACALAPTYETLMAARVFTAFAHAAFFGIAAVVAADLVPANRRASAIALVFAGLTVANIMGVPAGTAWGQAFGWRSTFLAVAAIGAVAIAAVAVFLPANLQNRKADLATEFHATLRPQVLLAMAITVLSSAALFAVLTFITPILTEVSGFAAATVPWVLLVFGVGMTAGAFAGARLADWRTMPSIIGITVAIALILVLLVFAMSSPALMVAAAFLWGVAAFALGVCLQLRVVTVAAEAPNVASTLNQAAFNLGNATGATIGAAALGAGLAYADLPFVGLMLILAALAAGILSVMLDQRPGVGTAVPA